MRALIGVVDHVPRLALPDSHVHCVEDELGLARARRDELTPALEAVGQTPGDYSSKLRLELDPAERAGDAEPARNAPRPAMRTSRWRYRPGWRAS